MTINNTRERVEGREIQFGGGLREEERENVGVGERERAKLRWMLFIYYISAVSNFITPEALKLHVNQFTRIHQYKSSAPGIYMRPPLPIPPSTSNPSPPLPLALTVLLSSSSSSSLPHT